MTLLNCCQADELKDREEEKYKKYHAPAPALSVLIELSERTLTELEVREKQTKNAMYSYISGNNKQQNLEPSSIVRENKVQKDDSNFSIYVDTSLDRKELKQRRNNFIEIWQELEMKAKDITKEAAYHYEVKPMINELYLQISSIKKEVFRKTIRSFASLYYFSDLEWWLDLKSMKSKNDFFDFVSFFHSDFYKNIPFLDIKTSLLSASLVSNGRIEKNDREDILQTSLVLPYCDFIIVDASTKHKICNVYSLDKKYNTKIFALKDGAERIMDSILTNIEGKR